ncbi:MAG: hypothetical protein U9R16_04290 [Campylobacterota bacterium]|nr:hypothetical protein [Campylobacterota bacterium]
MNSIKIAIKNKTKLTQRLEKLYDVDYYKKQSLFSKLTFKNHNYPDIYFHQGILNDTAITMVENSKITIVNSNGMKLKIIDKLSAINKDKIQVVYPYVNSTTAYTKDLKKEFKSKFEIEKDTKMIFFQGKDLTLSGIKSFLEILEHMHKTNFIVMIESSSKEIQKIKLQINRAKLPYKVIFFEDYENIDELFIVSDIFILPTKLKLFAPSVLKAMYYKNAVFVMSTNYSAELIDTFSLIQDEYDRSTPFKIDALLINNDELKKIQKDNHKKSLNFGFESRVDMVTSIIENKLI